MATPRTFTALAGPSTCTETETVRIVTRLVSLHDLLNLPLGIFFFYPSFDDIEYNVH